MYEQLELMTYPTQTSGASASHARTSASQASKKACKKVSEADCFTKLCDCLPAVGKKIDPDGYSLKMLKIYLALETDLTSHGCCLKWGGTGTLSNGTLSTAKTTEDSLSSRLGRLYGIERGLDCGPNIIMDQYWKVWDGGERQDRYKWYYEADFLYITKSYYLYEVEVKISISDFRADQKKNKYHDHPDVKGLYYFIPQELYSKHIDEIKATCKEKGAGLIVDGCPISTVLKPKVRKDVKPLSDNGYIHYLRLFAKKWVRER